MLHNYGAIQKQNKHVYTTNARASLKGMATQWHAWTRLRICTVSWITRTLHETCPYSLISPWTPMYTTCHTSPSLSNVMESLGFGSKDTFKTLTAYPIAQVIIWATHNTLDHWWLNKNVRVLLIFITLYNNISAKKHNIHKQAICTCLPPALNDAIKLVLGDKYSSLLLLLLLIYLFIYLFSIPEIHQTGYRTCH